MNIYLAKITGNDEEDESYSFYDLVKAETPSKARDKIETAYGYRYEIEIKIPIE
tara:strand:- start:1114 stop:1275 length:162 start_codon:yes stop_codon:yes gene_type:complete